MSLTYEALHWGDAPTDIRRLVVADGDRGARIERLVALSYVTSKRGNADIWRHAFEHDAWLLWLERGGRYTAPRTSGELLALGRVVDIELESGKRIVPGELWVCADAVETPSPVLLAAPAPLRYAIEHTQVPRGIVPHVTAHGIEK